MEKKGGLFQHIREELLLKSTDFQEELYLVRDNMSQQRERIWENQRGKLFKEKLLRKVQVASRVGPALRHRQDLPQPQAR